MYYFQHSYNKKLLMRDVVFSICWSICWSHINKAAEFTCHAFTKDSIKMKQQTVALQKMYYPVNGYTMWPFYSCDTNSQQIQGLTCCKISTVICSYFLKTSLDAFYTQNRFFKLLILYSCCFFQLFILITLSKCTA